MQNVSRAWKVGISFFRTRGWFGVGTVQGRAITVLVPALGDSDLATDLGGKQIFLLRVWRGGDEAN